MTVGEYEDGRPGEVFMKVSKQGSTLAGIMDAFAISVSLGLQHGVPLATYVTKYTNMRFEPAGMTDDPELRIAQSLVDYIFRRLAVDYLPLEERIELGVLTSAERTQPTLPGDRGGRPPPTRRSTPGPSAAGGAPIFDGLDDVWDRGACRAAHGGVGRPLLLPVRGADAAGRAAATPAPLAVPPAAAPDLWRAPQRRAARPDWRARSTGLVSSGAGCSGACLKQPAAGLSDRRNARLHRRDTTEYTEEE